MYFLFYSKIISQSIAVFRISLYRFESENDSHDFRKYKTLDVITIIDAITERRRHCSAHDGWTDDEVHVKVSNGVLLPRERLSAIYSAGRIKKPFVAG